MLEGRGRGRWVMESGRLNYHSSSVSPPCLCADLVWSFSDNKAAHRNPARGTYLGSDHWAGTGCEGARGRPRVCAGRERGQKTPQNGADQLPKAREEERVCWVQPRTAPGYMHLHRQAEAWRE